MENERLNVKINFEVDGNEGFSTTVEYKNTDAKTVLLLEKALLSLLNNLVDAQIKE